MDSKQEKQNCQISFTRLRIIKNLIVISLTFVLLFSAYDGLSMLQTTMNGKQGIGSASQAIIYTAFAIASLVLPKYTIKKLGCKRTLFVGTVLYLPYIGANIYPTWITMMSSAVFVGIGSAILFAAQSTYFNEAAELYCDLLEDCKPGKKPKVTKSGSRNFDLFVIQDGINEKMVSFPVLKSEYNILNPHYFGKHMKSCIADSDCSTVKVISLINYPCLKTLANNIEINHSKNTELIEKNDETYDTFDDQLTRNSVTTSEYNEKSIGDIDSSANVTSLLENKFLKKNSIKSIVDIDPLANVTSLSENKFLKKNSIKSIGDSLANVTSLPENRFVKKHSIISINEFTMNSVNGFYKKMSLASLNVEMENTSKFFALEYITARFFGCFGMMYYTAQIWSNLITYYVLNNNSEQNVTLFSNYSCGAGFCNSEYEVVSGAADEILSSTRYLLIGVNLSLNVVSSLLVLFLLDPLGTVEEGVTFSLSHVMATFNQFKKKEQLLVIPLSMFSGMSQGFYTADFTKAYIQCAWSISNVGMVTVFYGIASGITSTISGYMVKYIGRIPIVLFGLALHVGIDVFLMMWNPSADNHFMFYLTASLWGAKIGIFWSQTQAFYGLLFKNDEEAAFACYNFCTAIGWTITFSYSDYLCTSPKIYVLVVLSCLGILGYLAADRSFRQRKIS